MEDNSLASFIPKGISKDKNIIPWRIFNIVL